MSSSALDNLYNLISNPQEELELVRKGVKPAAIDAFMKEQEFSTNDVLERLKISRTTYFSRKKFKRNLDSAMTERLLRLVQVMKKAKKVLGHLEARAWVYRAIPSLGNQRPMDLLDTEPGHRLVESALLQIEYGVYG
jgi:putative toxin-antitoxin system antitoxin component (TIGR02293 family)